MFVFYPRLPQPCHANECTAGHVDLFVQVDGKFEHFKKHHGKSYQDEADEGQRKTYFRHNHR